MNDVKYPNVNVELVGQDGNAFSIMGRVGRALKEANVLLEEIERYREEAMSGDYNNLLQVTMKWVNTD